WAGNSREFRLTPWANDPVSDPHHEWLALRDLATGETWSPLPGPTPKDGTYEMRHGFGYSRCHHESGGLEVETLIWVPVNDPVKVVKVRVTNHGTSARRLALTSCQRLVLGALPEVSGRTVVTSWDKDSQVLLARQQVSDDFRQGVAFGAGVADAPVATRFTA